MAASGFLFCLVLHLSLTFSAAQISIFSSPLRQIQAQIRARPSDTSAGVAAGLNSQSLPSVGGDVQRLNDRLVSVALNPQPLPPGPGSTSPSTSTSTSASIATSLSSAVMIQPQPLPPGSSSSASSSTSASTPVSTSAAMGIMTGQGVTALRVSDSLAAVALNPQPLPPLAGAAGGAQFKRILLNPQPLPPGDVATRRTYQFNTGSDSSSHSHSHSHSHSPSTSTEETTEEPTEEPTDTPTDIPTKIPSQHFPPFANPSHRILLDSTATEETTEEPTDTPTELPTDIYSQKQLRPFANPHHRRLLGDSSPRSPSTEEPMDSPTELPSEQPMDNLEPTDTQARPPPAGQVSRGVPPRPPTNQGSGGDDGDDGDDADDEGSRTLPPISELNPQYEEPLNPQPLPPVEDLAMDSETKWNRQYLSTQFNPVITDLINQGQDQQLNPQPLPPRWQRRPEFMVSAAELRFNPSFSELNPQPLPPRWTPGLVLSDHTVGTAFDAGRLVGPSLPIFALP